MGIALLIRHGRSTANVDGILAGRMPGVGLHESGREQARAMRLAFQGVSLASVTVSPLQRTLETASIIFGEHSFQTSEALLECDYGNWSGRRIEELTSDPLWTQLHAHPSATTFPAGESVVQVAVRMVQFVTQQAAAPGLHAFVSHADPIMMAVSHAAGAPLDAYQRLDVEPCSLSVLLVHEGRSGVVAMNVPPAGAGATLQSLLRWQRTSVSEGGHDDANHPSL
ncbi:MAG: histidine phosphatase family protein [Candidatus Nanopelagicales bacterium]